MNEKYEIINELSEEIEHGKGCIVFDFACFFPYANWKDKLKFKVKLDQKELNSYVLNNRYPNHAYVTLTKKSGRKLSKIGYPYFVELFQEHQITVEIEIGTQNIKNLIFNVLVTLTKDEPVCGLTFNFKDFDTFIFYSNKKSEDGWYTYTWSNQEKDHSERNITMIPTVVDDNYLIYSRIITPCPQRLDDLML